MAGLYAQRFRSTETLSATVAYREVLAGKHSNDPYVVKATEVLSDTGK